MARRTKVYDSEKARRAAYAEWGNINTQRKVMKGVYRFDTWGHGGYIAVIRSDEVQPWMDVVHRWSDGSVTVAFEEDCNWSRLIIWKPEVARAEFEKQDYTREYYGTVEKYFYDALWVAKRWSTVEEWAQIEPSIHEDVKPYLAQVEDVKPMVA